MDFDKLVSFQSTEECFAQIESDICGGDPQTWPSLTRWISLLDLNSVQNWLIGSEWANSASNARLSEAIAVLKHVLRRRLVDLATRANLDPLDELWHWCVERVGGSDRFKDIWRAQEGQVRETFCPVTDAPVHAQETAYVNLLRSIRKEFERDAALGWAAEVLSGIAEARDPATRVVRPRARVVFAWDEFLQRLPFFRKGILLEFSLESKSGRRGVPATHWLALPMSRVCADPDSELERIRSLFDSHFCDAMVSLASRRANWYPISLVDEGLPHFPSNFRFTGGSFALAVGVVQELANQSARWQSRCALPPYVVVTATADPNNLNVSGSVGQLEEKLSLLLSEGVRTIVVSSQQPTVEVPEWAAGRIEFIRTPGPETRLARRLRSRAQRADIEALDHTAWLTRREFAAGVVGLGAAAFAGYELNRFINRPQPTSSMVRHWVRLSDFDAKLDEVASHTGGVDELRYFSLLKKCGSAVQSIGLARNVIVDRAIERLAANPRGIRAAPRLTAEEREAIDDKSLLSRSDDFWNGPENPLRKIRDELRRSLSEATGCPFDQVLVAEKPLKGTDFYEAGFEILEDSKLFDNSLWKEVPSVDGLDKGSREDLLHLLPVEPALFTRLLRLRQRANGHSSVTRIVFELNTSGYGVLPLQDSECPIVSTRVFVSRMTESKAPNNRTITLLVEKDISSKLGNVELDVGFEGIFFNGFQDQTVRRVNGEDNWDWWGTRVNKMTRKADFAIGLPADLDMRVGQDIRYEDVDWKHLKYDSDKVGPVERRSPDIWKGRTWHIWRHDVKATTTMQPGQLVFRTKGRWQQ